MQTEHIVSHLVKLALLLAAWTVNSAVFAQAGAALNLVTGWNLLGNSSAVPVDVAATFGDVAKITTVWTWNKAGSKWAFYAPSMTPSALAAYAQGKGYDVLTGIPPKEGFWVNASTPAALTGPVANQVTLVASDLQQGWNLLASADNKTPSQLNQALSSSLNAAAKAMVSAWAWDAPNTKWRFYAPSLEAQGGTALADYITAKGYLPFSTALSAVDGVWLNIGAGTPVGPTLVSIAVTPLDNSIMVGNKQAYVAMGTYSDGSSADISNAVTWISEFPELATISPTGVVTGVWSGFLRITATSGGKSASAALIVIMDPLGCSDM